jgi:uncharacterized protein YcfL
MKRRIFELTLTLLIVVISGCDLKETEYLVKKVTVVHYKSYRANNTLQEYEPLWKATLSDSSVVTLRRKPQIGDTLEYRFPVARRQKLQ